MKLSTIAAHVDGEIDGDGDPDLTGVAPLDRAGPSDLSFVATPKYGRYVAGTRAGALLVTADTAGASVDARVPRLLVQDVHHALARILPELYPAKVPEPGVHASAVIGPASTLGRDVRIEAGAVVEDGARIGDRVRIGANAYVGADCDLAEDVVLHANVTLYPGVRIGARSVLHAGVRVGVDGFGYVHEGGRHRKVPQVGGCVIGTDVEVGANSTIDRGSVGDTEIGDGVKIDNLVHIGHNVRVGAHALIVAQVGIAGSTRVGEYAVLAGQAGLVGHIEIGAGARIGAQAGVFGDVPAGETYSGYPARPHREALRAQAALFRMPAVLKRFRTLERRSRGDADDDEA